MKSTKSNSKTFTDPGEVLNTNVFHRSTKLAKQPLLIPKDGQDLISCFTIMHGETGVVTIGSLTSPEIYCLDEPPNSNNYNLYLEAMTPKVIMQPPQIYLDVLLLLNPLCAKQHLRPSEPSKQKPPQNRFMKSVSVLLALLTN